MKLALSRGGLWFFGTMIFVIVFGQENLKDESLLEVIGTVAFFGAIVGGAIFCYTWYEYEQQERELELKSRRKALEADELSDKTR